MRRAPPAKDAYAEAHAERQRVAGKRGQKRGALGYDAALARAEEVFAAAASEQGGEAAAAPLPGVELI